MPLDELKQMLDCDKVETYKEFKEFNKQVLKRIQKEMHEKTECKYTYEPIKKGRTVVGIRFEVETLPKLEVKFQKRQRRKKGNQIAHFGKVHWMNGNYHRHS